MGPRYLHGGNRRGRLHEDEVREAERVEVHDEHVAEDRAERSTASACTEKILESTCAGEIGEGACRRT